MRKLLLSSALLAGMTLSGCQKPVYYDITAPSFHDATPFYVDVERVRTVDDGAQVPGTHVEDQFPTSPKQAIQIWSDDRLRPVGQTGTLELHILEASAVETPLPLQKGIKGAFTKEPSQRYTETMEVELRIYKGDSNISDANVRARVSITRELMEGAGPERRRELFAEMTRELTKQLDSQLEQRIEEIFPAYLKQLGTSWN